MDADYTAQMIRLLHTQGTPGFQTIVCYNLVRSQHLVSSSCIDPILATQRRREGCSLLLQ